MLAPSTIYMVSLRIYKYVNAPFSSDVCSSAASGVSPNLSGEDTAEITTAPQGKTPPVTIIDAQIISRIARCVNVRSGILCDVLITRTVILGSCESLPKFNVEIEN
jgi:hypothetical protein